MQPAAQSRTGAAGGVVHSGVHRLWTPLGAVRGLAVGLARGRNLTARFGAAQWGRAPQRGVEGRNPACRAVLFPIRANAADPPFDPPVSESVPWSRSAPTRTPLPCAEVSPPRCRSAQAVPAVAVPRMCEAWSQTGEQADISAEQPSSCQDPRVPAAHAHPRRSGHRRLAPRQGPQQALGLTAGPAGSGPPITCSRSEISCFPPLTACGAARTSR